MTQVGASDRLAAASAIEERGRASRPFAEPPFDAIDRALHVGPALGAEKGELLGSGRDEAGCRHAEQSDPPALARQAFEELASRPV